MTTRIDRLTARGLVTRRVDPTNRRRVLIELTATGRELVDLPLNGRNFTQLGLLQAGVAPLTAGVATAGGSLRLGQGYAVNGMRPEQNIYLVDGAQNMNRMDGGYALKVFWNDGHSGGIYSWEHLRKICPCPACRARRESDE